MCSFTLGEDPELLCRLNGKYVSAHNYFKSNLSFGLDCCEAIAEVRPGFSESPIDITSKVFQILEYGHTKAPDKEFYAGHFVDNLSLGGHLHFSIQPEPNIVEALDTVLYSLSNCIDDREQRAKREKCGYGKRKATRKQPHGFEYRTPGSWLLSLSTTLVTFTLAKLAVIGVTEDNHPTIQILYFFSFCRNLKFRFVSPNPMLT